MSGLIQEQMVFLPNRKYECYTCGKPSHNWGCRWKEKYYCSKLCRTIDINDQIQIDIIKNNVGESFD